MECTTGCSSRSIIIKKSWEKAGWIDKERERVCVWMGKFNDVTNRKSDKAEKMRSWRKKLVE